MKDKTSSQESEFVGATQLEEEENNSNDTDTWHTNSNDMVKKNMHFQHQSWANIVEDEEAERNL